MKFHIAYEDNRTIYVQGKTIEAESFKDALKKIEKEFNIKEENIIYISNMEKSTNR